MITTIIIISTGINYKCISEKELIAVIKKLRKDTSPGFDGILSNLSI